MIRSLLTASFLLLALPAAAQVPFSATLTATDACPASTSIRGQSDAGNPVLTAGQSYRVVGKNKADATFYQVVVDGGRRWVAVSCFGGGAGATPLTGNPGGDTNGNTVAATYLLAVSWQPAFCRSHRAAAECSGGGNTGLGLHGLWPQPIGKAYCGVSADLKSADSRHDWDSLPEPELSAGTRQRLAAVMPGVRSELERHEWIRHGTCSGLSADAYFNRAADLAEQVIGSGLGQALAADAGRSLTVAALRSAVDSALGAGTGSRAQMTCEGKGSQRDFSEIWIGLAGDVTGTAKLADLIRAAAPAKPGCPVGLVE